eukprot:GHVR01048861.1.p1 GENE.GHVR01048861.1~~GHVR01048861.1.p1  ORF type:complete len:133 (+),score=43.30 GHVR01048861.1:46-444(+)
MKLFVPTIVACLVGSSYGVPMSGDDRDMYHPEEEIEEEIDQRHNTQRNTRRDPLQYEKYLEELKQRMGSGDDPRNLDEIMKDIMGGANLPGMERRGGPHKGAKRQENDGYKKDENRKKRRSPPKFHEEMEEI